VPNYQIFWIIKICTLTYVISNIDSRNEMNLTYVVTRHMFVNVPVLGAAQLIRGVFHLDISFICWFKAIRVPFYTFWSSSVSTTNAEGPDDSGPGVFRA
jgi:hypothetical protein